MTTRHPTVTDEGRRLLEGATPGPWKQDAWYAVAEVKDGRPGGEVIVQCRPTVPGRVLYDERRDRANAALIVWLRNNADAFLAAVKALQRLVDWRGQEEWSDAIAEARAALAPFTEEPTDGRD